MKRFLLWLVAITYLASSAIAQSNAPANQNASPRLSRSKQDVIEAAKAYKESLDRLLVFQESDLKTALAVLEERKAAKENTDKAQRLVEVAQAKLQETKQKMADADNLIQETLTRPDPAPVAKRKNQVKKPAHKNVTSKKKGCKGCVTA